MIGWTDGQSTQAIPTFLVLALTAFVMAGMAFTYIKAIEGAFYCPYGQPVSTSWIATCELIESATGSAIDMDSWSHPLGAPGKDETPTMGHRSQTSRHFGPYGGIFFRMFCDVMRKNDGVSAVEFALLAPILIFGMLATVDMGMAISERMTIGHILRAGAQSAIEDVGIAKVDLVLRTTAAKNMTVAGAQSAGTDTSLALAVQRMCACAAQPSAAVACSTTCAQNAPTQVYYILSANKTYAGLILPRFTQSKILEVQVR